MKFQSGEKKLLAICVVAIALPLTAGVYLNHINVTPIVNIPAPPKPPKPNGYDGYVAAATAMKPAAPPVDAVNDVTLITNPKIIAQQYSLARKTAWLRGNQAGFALFNQAMKTPSLAPPNRGNATAAVFTSYAKLRELARVKTIESNARWMSGDYNGALKSGLDTVQMGHDMRRGGVIITDLVGIAIGAIGRSVTHDTVDKLDANQAKIAARRLDNLQQTRWNLAQTLTEDKYYAQSSWLEIFKTKEWRSPKSLMNPEQLTIIDRLRILTIPKQQIMDDVAASYDHEIANSRLPYLGQKPPLEFPNDPFQEMFGISSRLKFSDARDLAGDQLLIFRLALRAYRLENGAYPTNLQVLAPRYLKSIPSDPFGGGQGWNYTRTGQNYLLYSIGPDGKDNGGTPIPWRNRARKSIAGKRERLPPLMPDSLGDYVAGKNG